MKGTVKGCAMLGGFRPSQSLDPNALGLEGAALRIARVIAEETEAQREIERAKFPDSEPASNGLPRGGLLGGSFISYADSLRWELLLTFGGCVFRCAARLELEPSKVVSFAIDHCLPHEMWLLFWYEQALEAHMKLLDAEAARLALAQAQSKAQAKDREQQRLRAKRRIELDRDGKQAAKQEVKDCWERWRKDPKQYKGIAAFARAMLDKYPDQLKSQPVIEGWVRAWNAEAKKS